MSAATARAIRRWRVPLSLCSTAGIWALAAGAFAAMPSVAHAQILLDLAQPSGTAVTRSVLPGQFSVILVNAVPNLPYLRTIEVETILVEALPKTPMGVRATLAPPCEEKTINDWAAQMAAARTEEAVRDLVQAPPKADTPPCAAAVARAIDATRVPLTDLPPIASGEQLTITITRLTDGAPRTWQLVLKTPVGRWLTTYGLGFAANRDRHYYSKATDTANEFTVTEETPLTGKDRALKFIPTVLFSWLPPDAGRRAWAHGFTAGVGATTDNVALFVGYSANYRRNVHLAAGLVVTQFTRLSGQYSVGQTLSTNLTPDALQQKVFLPSVFFAGTFGFGANPFGGTQENPSTARRTASSGQTR